MSNTMRWIVAALLMGVGLFAAVFSLAFLGFFTWECYGAPNATAYSILYVAAIISVIGGIVPAVMLVRKAAGKFVALAVFLGILLTIASNGAFLFYTTNVC